MPSVTKTEVRKKVWTALARAGAGRFPFPLTGRIPNFEGAEQAAARLARHPVWRQARILKCNPDAPQRPVRLRALEDGKIVYMAVPRLRSQRCFLRLDPAEIDPRHLRRAAGIAGSARYGVPVTAGELPPIDLIVAGSVAVRPNGARAGKGGGYSDLEFGLATLLGKIQDATRIVTTVHDLQVVSDRWPVAPYDIPLDYIFTPSRTMKCKHPHPRPESIVWELLDPAMRRDIPALDALAP